MSSRDLGEAKYFFGLMYRPYAPGAVPAGVVERGRMASPPFKARQGWVGYAERPSERDIKTYDLQPLDFDPREREQA